MATNNPCPTPPLPSTATDPMLTIAQVSSVILFDPDTGEIATRLQENTAVGATHPTQAATEAKARRIYVALHPGGATNLAALHLNGPISSVMCPGTTYKVVDCAVVPG